MEANTETIIKYFEAIDVVRRSRGLAYEATDFGEDSDDTGMFAGSSLRHLYPGLARLVAEGAIQPGFFSDAGCGDGRVLALVSEAFKIQALGIEGDPRFLGYTDQNIAALRGQGLLNGCSIGTVLGNFNEDAAYIAAGVDFRDISAHYHYVNVPSYRFLAKRIAEKSKPGTLYLLNDSTHSQEQFDRLKLSMILVLKKDNPKLYMHVYRKV